VTSGLRLAGARLTSRLRGGAGGYTGPLGPRPAAPLVLYEFEACPFCRRVREALTELALPALVQPCPKGGRRHRPEVLREGGREQFPWLVDPNTGRRLYESADIVDYLHATYGPRAVREGAMRAAPGAARRSTLAVVLSGLGRGTAGSRARPSVAPAEPLVLHGFEAQPESRLVRETLCELELAYVHRPAAPAVAGGRAEPPRLVDPNAASEHVGWRAIVAHLEATYAR